MKTHHRSRRPALPPPGYVQPCLPMYQAPVAQAADKPAASAKPLEQLPAQTFAYLVTALQAAFCDLAKLRGQYTVLHGKKAERLLVRVQEVVDEQIALLEQQRGQQRLLVRLRCLVIECREALVTVRGICGLAETGLLLRDPTGTYWQFGNALLALWRSCQAIAAHMTKQEDLDRVSSAPRVLSA